MDYGRIPEKDIEKVNYRLPPDAPSVSLVLNGNGTGAKIYMGTPKWGRKEWIGKLYPKGTRDAQFLEEYVKNYNAIELNSTHYKIYTSEEIARWTAKTGDRHFKFCPRIFDLLVGFIRELAVQVPDF